MSYPSFKDYVVFKEEGEPSNGASQKDWRKEFHQLEKGFIPPPKMRPIIEAFLESSSIKVMHDTSKPVTLPKKSLFLVGGPVRDFLAGKTIKDYDLATNATPEQVALILSAGGFHMAPERGGSTQEGKADAAGKEPKPLKLTFRPKLAEKGDKKIWFIKGRDSSEDRKVFVISAVVDGEEFEIATFRRDAKVTDGAASVDFVDNPTEDASRRDLTINAMYIELTKADGENSKLYDPTGKGLHDARNKLVRTVGKAKDRFNEDKLRVMRAIRFHCRFGSGMRMDKDIEDSLADFADLRGVALERVRDEFLKGLLHPDVDIERYIKIYNRTGLIKRVFPGVQVNMNIPSEFTSRKDKPLALAWLLQGNPIEAVDSALSDKRDERGEQTPTGWSTQERRAVVFLLELLEFTPQDRAKMLKKMGGTGLTADQIREWINMFRRNEGGKTLDSRPTWANHMRKFADNDRPLAKWDDVMQGGKDTCDKCRGPGCAYCGGTGKLPMHMRGKAVDELENERFADTLNKRD